MIKISEAISHIVREIFPKLEDELKMAQMKETPEELLKKAVLLALIFSAFLSLISLIVLSKLGMSLLVIPIFLVFILLILMIAMQIPKMNIARIRNEIEADIFVPSRMLLTLLESGSGLVSALERVSYTNAKSSKHFGMIATKIYLGKPLGEAIDEAIKYTPSESFRRVLQPIRKSLKTGTDIQKSLNGVLEDLAKEKAIEIERYEKRLGALSLFYMIFGVIVPAISTIILVVVMSVIGLKINFFPFLFILMLFTLFIHFIFIRVFQEIRPLMRF